MRTVSVVAAAAVALSVVLPAGVSGAGEAAQVEIAEWPVPWEDTRPRDPYVDGRGRVWFVGQRGDYLASFEPATAAFRRLDLTADGGVSYVDYAQGYLGASTR